MQTHERLFALGEKLNEMQEQIRHDKKLACRNKFAQAELLRSISFIEQAMISAFIASDHEELSAEPE